MRRIQGNGAILSEHYEQVNFVCWFRTTFEEEIISIPNGGARTRSQGAKLKAEGVKAGVSDLFVPAWLLWIEMKRSDGGSGLSKPQKEWRDYVESLGHNFMCCYGFEHAKSSILRFVEEG